MSSDDRVGVDLLGGGRGGMDDPLSGGASVGGSGASVGALRERISHGMLREKSAASE
jgi:hypothetical protein